MKRLSASATDNCEMCTTQPVRSRSRTDLQSLTVNWTIFNASPQRTGTSLDTVLVDCGTAVIVVWCWCNNINNDESIPRSIDNYLCEKCLVRYFTAILGILPVGQRRKASSEGAGMESEKQGRCSE